MSSRVSDRQHAHPQPAAPAGGRRAARSRRWSQRRAAAAWLPAIGMLLLGWNVVAGPGATPAQDRSQLVRFSHRFHLEEAGAGCDDCHPGTATSAAAADNLLPTMERCYACHDEDETACSFCHLEQVESGDYTGFLAPAREIQFDHQLHTETLDLECERCHAGLAGVDYAGPAQRAAMQGCVDCHTERRVTTDCMFCHTQPQALRPASHDTGFRQRHEMLVRAGDASCATCHGSNDCQECHDGEQLLGSTASPVRGVTPTAPSAGETRSPYTLGRVHALDYRFTHSLDARGKENDCRVCHEAQNFCSDCHGADGGAGQLRPLWHGGADWGAEPGGVGTGGGRHAELARRDLERCAACHDVQGEDPTCLACHVDRSPGLGNDPRTHEPGFMRSVEGAWHDDPNDTCFVCHQRSSGDQPGFCTYCHDARSE